MVGRSTNNKEWGKKPHSKQYQVKKVIQKKILAHH